MNWRKYDPADYEVIAPWFTSHGWKHPPDSSVLPSTGIMICEEEKPLAVGFLYLSNSILGWFDWVAVVPGIPQTKSLRALDLLIATVKEAAVGAGVSVLMHFTKGKYVRVYEKRFGFLKSEEATMMLWKGGV